ncbi:MAG: right-handed parallel beta-helix repeat-containing protein [Flavobacteriales bacterium]|nr:right-handed parallel beta-helix repeat-containing protein [Flavobacteriales bacterium]MBP9159566.1 right-handed parallel beta-helix repeat-containing protein [Flavobacteriales bacterium]
MRKGKRANIQPTAWLFALAIPAALLFVVFSLMPYGTMVKQWPLSIGQPEVMAFQKVFDRRPGQHATGEAGTLNLTSSNGNCKTGQAVAATETDTATVEVRELQGSDEGIELVGSDAQGLNGAERTALMPADLSSLEVLYAQAVADSLPIHSAPLDLVRLSRCGSDAGPFLMQEATSPSMVARSASASGTFLGPDGKPTNTSTTEATDAARMPKLTGAAFDTSASAALGLLACIEQRKDLLNAETGALYDGITGRIVPLYRMAYGADTAANTQPLGVALREALGTASAQKRIQRMAKKIHADSAAWAQRFAAIDSARVPVLANGRNIGLVQAAVDRTREQFMQRLFHPDPEAFIGQPAQTTPTEKATLDPWLAQFKSGSDTLRFVRGKYDIDHDLDIPAGYGVVLEKGTRWNIAAGVNITIHGAFHARGTELNPVFIRPLDGVGPFGSITVEGTGDTRVRLRGVRISDGSEQWSNGLHRPGMLSFVLCDVQVDKCSIGSSSGTASISVQRGNGHVTDSYFIGSRKSALLFLEAHANVERCGFSGEGVTAPDGISSVGATVLVRGCTFNRIGGSALEFTGGSRALVSATTLTANNIALLTTEGAAVHVDACTFNGNATAVLVRSAASAWGETNLVMHTNTMTGNGKERDVQGGTVKDDPAPVDPGKWLAGAE